MRDDHRCRLRVVVAVLFVAGLTACGTTKVTGAPVPGTSVPTTTAVSGIPEPPPLEQWVTTTDPATGVSFALPGEAEIKQGPGDAGTSTPPGTMYQVKLGKFGLTAVFGETTTTHSKEGLDQFVDTWDARFKSNGVDDGKVTNRQHTTVQDRPALDFQASFTAKTGVKNVWFVRVIGEQTRAIQLISMVFVEPGEETSAPAAVEKYHSQLLDSVRLP